MSNSNIPISEIKKEIIKSISESSSSSPPGYYEVEIRNAVRALVSARKIDEVDARLLTGLLIKMVKREIKEKDQEYMDVITKCLDRIEGEGL